MNEWMDAHRMLDEFSLNSMRKYYIVCTFSCSVIFIRRFEDTQMTHLRVVIILMLVVTITIEGMNWQMAHAKWAHKKDKEIIFTFLIFKLEISHFSQKTTQQKKEKKVFKVFTILAASLHHLYTNKQIKMAFSSKKVFSISVVLLLITDCKSNSNQKNGTILYLLGWF